MADRAAFAFRKASAATYQPIGIAGIAQNPQQGGIHVGFLAQKVLRSEQHSMFPIHGAEFDIVAHKCLFPKLRPADPSES